MNISVILCTYNRCQALANVLDTLAASKLPDSVEWEAVVVDNNSRDQTRAVVDEFCERYPGRFRYLFEPQQGKAHALNTGIQEARGNILAFLHDDVTVEPTWLQNLTSSLDDPRWVGAGGRVELQWPPSLPDWLDPHGPQPHHGFPCFDLGPDIQELPCPPVGANMAFRKTAFARYGVFRTDSAPNSGHDAPAIDEYTEFGRRLISAGNHLRYEHSAVVHQVVPEAKINREYLLAQAFEKGRTAAAENSRISPLRVMGSLAIWKFRGMFSVKPPMKFFCRLVVREKVGTLEAIRQHSQQVKHTKELKAAAIRRNIAEIKRDRANLLDLKAGEWVEVRTQQEILATLDERGRLGNVPFMPEMLQYCGKQFRVHRRVDKTCDNIEPWSIRRMNNAVLLEGLRCEGEGHGGCQAGCMIFWKEAWLKRAAKNVVPAEALRKDRTVLSDQRPLCTVATILEESARTDTKGETVYCCQATEVLTFTTYMPSWDPRQYVRDLRSGNLATGLAQDSRSHRAFEVVLGILRILHSIALSLFNTLQQKRSRRPGYPYLGGTATRIPIEVLNLQPGELVQVRSKEEIVATLDKQDRHRGLLFDGAMLTYCGGIYRVLRRVHRIVDEKTGKMLYMKNPCIALEGVTCRWDYHRLCPRDTCTPYWRENWLKRAVDLPEPLPAGQIAKICDKC